MKFEDLNLLDVGTKYMLVGAVWASTDDAFVTVFPDTDREMPPIKELPMTTEQWEKFLRQVDIVEVEIFEKVNGQIAKSLVRKSQRAIDAFLQWKVFKRDNYTCRYCGKTALPLTVDHIDLWEAGGATIEQNLITACKKCNKDRGNMPYGVWLTSPIYHRLSTGLSEEIKQQNEDVLKTLPELQKLRYTSRRSRK